MVLDMIQVDRAFRGQGIGRLLFNLAVAEARNAGAKEQFLKGYRTHHAFTEEMEASMPLMRRFINLYSYARLRHCLSEPVADPPEWLKHLVKRLRSKLNHLEKLMAP